MLSNISLTGPLLGKTVGAEDRDESFECSFIPVMCRCLIPCSVLFETDTQIFYFERFCSFKANSLFFFFFLFPTKGKLARLRLLNINFNNFIFDFVELDLFPELIGTEEIIKVS